jgi:hypothetical protein
MIRSKQEQLAAELTAGHPVSGAYDADQDLAFAQLQALNVPNPVAQKVSYNDIIAYLTYTQRIVGIMQSADPAAIELVFLATQTKLINVDFSNAATVISVTRLLDALMAIGLIDAGDHAYIFSMANPLISQNQALSLGAKAFDITNARAL